MSGHKPRQIALDILGRRDRGTTGLRDHKTTGRRRAGGASAPQARPRDNGTRSDYIEDLLDRVLEQALLLPADRRLAQELTYGVVRWEATLDWLIERKLPRLPKPQVQNLLRLGLYQIFWLERIPNHAAVHETVELAKKNGFTRQAGLVNAVLRGYLREFDATKTMLAELKVRQPHLGYSHPEWLVVRWQKRWGVEQAAQLMEWNNTPARTYARLNTLKANAASLQEQWRAENVEAEPLRRDWLEENLIFELKFHPPLAELPSFKLGLFYLQDPSTLLAVRELDPRPGETILDLCAAPGGKLTYMAQLMRNEGRIIAHDISPQRLQLIQENCARLGITCVQPVLPAALSSLPAASFDRILVDAPCSNTGVMRRRVDLRWRIRPPELSRLKQTQLGLLQQAAPLLKPGGTLVYSTCSLEPEENTQSVTSFLATQAILKLESERELLPFLDGLDGVYMATLRSAIAQP